MKKDNNRNVATLVTAQHVVIVLLIAFGGFLWGGVVQENREILKQIQASIEAQKQPIEEPQAAINSVNWAAVSNAVIQVESSGNPKAVSHAGARGLMQIMEPTWTEMTTKIYGAALPFDKAFDPEINRKVGTRYLQWIDDYLRNRLGDDYSFTGTIMSYYWGIGNYCKHVENNPEDPFPADVRGYYEKFQSFYARRTQ